MLIIELVPILKEPGLVRAIEEKMDYDMLINKYSEGYLDKEHIVRESMFSINIVCKQGKC